VKLALLGVGNAGSRLVDALIDAERRTGRNFTNGNVLAFNTTPTVFADVEHIEQAQQVVVGDTHPDVNQPPAGTPSEQPPDDDQAETGDTDTHEEQTGRREGVAGDPELGVTVAREDASEIRRALDLVDETAVDAALIVAGLGGGTGCGVGAVLLEELQAVYEIPVYVLGVLPTPDESDVRALTAARAVRTFVPLANAVFPVDNAAWASEVGNATGYGEINEAVATRLVSLFAAGESEAVLLPELQMDPTDITQTLAIGGLATIGYAARELDGHSETLLTRVRRLLGLAVSAPEPETDAVSIKKLVQQALDSTLTLPCDVTSADRVLLILSGPPDELSRKGFETGRYLLETETEMVEVLAGDEPLRDADAVTATVLLSNVTGVPQLTALQERAVALQRERASDPQASGHGFQFSGGTTTTGSSSEPAEHTEQSNRTTQSEQSHEH